MDKNSSSFLTIVPIGSENKTTRVLESVKSSLIGSADITPVPLRHTSQKIKLPARHKKIERAVAARDEKAASRKRNPHPPDNEAPRKSLDLDAIDRIVRNIARESSDRVLPGTDKKLTSAEKFAEAIEHAQRGDCRSEHAHLGILAIPFLLKDTITGKGCKW
jgi:hypothetical protein